jgi:hypothetical protein
MSKTLQIFQAVPRVRRKLNLLLNVENQTLGGHN